MIEAILSYPMNPYALRTCAVGSSCHVLTDLTGAPNERIVQNHLNIALLNVF